MSLPALTSAMAFDVSVVICAYTQARWATLVAAVDSVRRQTLPAREILVVIDHNMCLLHRARAELQGVTILESTAEPGLAGARNAGVAASQGALIAFLDDDAQAAPDWLALLAQACAASDILGAGGLIEPAWQGGRPFWFPPEFDWVIGCSYHGLPQTRSAIRNPLGCSMCIRREVFDAVGGFRGTIGHIGHRPMGCEETELSIRARQRWPTGAFVYEPAAKVLHSVSPDRTRWSYFLSRCYWEGRSKAYVSRLVGAHDALSSERAYILQTLPQGIIRGLTDTLRRHDRGGLARAGAIVAGLITTGAGYLFGVAGLRIAARKPSVRSRAELVCSAPADAPARQIPSGTMLTGPTIGSGVMPRATGSRAGPLRVLLVTPRFLPSIGGVETHVHEVGHRLARMGVEVTVLATDLSGGLPEWENANGMCIRRVRGWPAHRDFHFAPGIPRLISHGKWDVVHCQGIHTLVAPLAMLAAWHAGIPYVVTFHTGGHSSRVRNALRGAQWRMLRPLLLRASRLIAVSEFEAEYFRKSLHLPAGLVTIIPNGAQLPVMREGPRHCAEEPPPSYPLIMSPGRLERYKGHQRVIAALPYVRAVFPKARLLILGAGPYKGALERLVHRLGLDDCVTIGAIPAADRCHMATHLAQADLVALLSEYEAQGIVAAEAAALGRSLLVADTSGLRELADRGLARTIPLHSSPHSVAEAILDQLRHPLVPVDVALPTWDECASRLLAVYRSAARRPACAS